MNLPQYDIIHDETPYIYQFISEGGETEGSTPSRNRLYRKGITRFLKQALEDFYIYGLVSEEIMEPFDPNGNYIGFLVYRKKRQ